jgi:hypothetical protein
LKPTSLRLLGVLGLSALAVLAGCLSACSGAAPQPERSSGVGQTVELDEGMSVTLASLDTTAPAKVESSRSDTHWMVFEMRNTSETTMSIPSRSAQPDIADANGQTLRVAGSSVLLLEGGGAWGPSAAQLGGPYIDPGGRWLMAFEVEGVTSADRPLRVEYSPTRGKIATFLLR